MKRLTAIFLPICILSFIAFGISVLILGDNRRVPEITITDHAESTVLMQGTGDEQYENIHAFMALGTLFIVPSGSDDTLVYIDDNLKDYVTVSTDGDTLNISLEWNTSKIIDNEFWSDLYKLMRGELSGEVVVHVPDRTYNSIALDVGAGTISVNDLRAEDVDINVSAGELYYSNPEGNIIDSLCANVSAGICCIDIATAQEYDFTVSAGSFDVDNLTGKGEISVSAGSAYISYRSFEGADATVSAGTLDMTLPWDTSAKIYCDKSAGNVILNEVGGKPRYLEDDNVYTLGGGEHTLEVDVSAGEVIITLADHENTAYSVGIDVLEERDSSAQFFEYTTMASTTVPEDRIVEAVRISGVLEEEQ